MKERQNSVGHPHMLPYIHQKQGLFSNLRGQDENTRVNGQCMYKLDILFILCVNPHYIVVE